MTPEQWRNREHEQMTPAHRKKIGLAWAEDLCLWLECRGYVLRESGPYNPETGRGWYSDPCEYQREHVRIRVGRGGIVVLRDPGAGIQITRMAPGGHGMEEQITPNAHRIDYPVSSMLGDSLSVMQRAIEGFESHPAYTRDEALSYFWPETAAERDIPRQRGD